ncbi:MAG: hypothetical protein WAK31_29795 [Chthoniobacterales bacterium]
MNENSDLWREFTDGFLLKQADAGDHLLGQECFDYRPTQEEMKALALEGHSLLFIDCLKGK